MNSQRVHYVLLLILPLVVYSNTLDNPFHYDDSHSIVDNPHIRQLLNIPSFFIDPTLFSAEPENAMYRPLLLSTFALNYFISDYAVWSYHVVGLLLHIGCMYWVYRLGLLLLKNSKGALLAALIFGLHPINSEAVNYISSRSEILASFFFLLAFYAFIKRQRTMMGFAYGAGLLSKSIVITLPALMLCYVVYEKRSWQRDRMDFGVLTVISLVYLMLVKTFLLNASIGNPVRGYNEQIWTQIKALIFYLKLLVEPIGLTVDHQFLISSSAFEVYVVFSLLMVLSLFGLSLWWGWQRHLAFLFSTWFLLVLTPTFIIPLNVLVNEHRLYLASGVFALGIGAFAKGISRYWSYKKVNVVFIVLVCVLGGLTVERNKVWATSYSLWKDAAQKAPLMARPWIFLAAIHQQDGHTEAARRAYENIIQRDPNHTPAYAALAALYIDEGKIEAAVAICRQGIEQAPAALIWNRYGEVYRYQAEQAANKEAYEKYMLLSAEAYRKSLELKENDAATHNNLGNTYQVLGIYKEALKHHQQALRLVPDDARTQVNLGNVWMANQQFKKAEMAYLEAVSLDPDYAGAWLSLGSVYQRQGQRIEAINAYKTALRLNPDYQTVVQKQLVQMEVGND